MTRLPIISRLVDEDGWLLQWNNKDLTFEVELYNNGKTNWSYRNKQSGSSIKSDGEISPDQFQEDINDYLGSIL